MRSTVVVLIVLLVAAGSWWLWAGQAEPPAAQYRYASLKRGPITQFISANGTINPVTVISVGTQVSGTVNKLLVNYNDHVDKGQILLTLDDSTFRAMVAQSKARLASAQASQALARANAVRSRGLYAKQYISKQDLDQAVQVLKTADAEVAVARAQLTRDQANLGYTVIRAPVDGVVMDRSVDVGQTVAASFQTPTLIKIAKDLSQMQINTHFAEADIGKIKAGQAVSFRVDAYPDASFKGQVKQVRLNPTNLQNVVTYDVVVAVDNSAGKLLPGMTAYVNVKVAHKDDVLRIPNNALRYRPPSAAPLRTTDADVSVVYLRQGEQLKPVKIHTGLYDDKFTEVTGDQLHAGDEVAIGSKAPAAKSSGSRRHGLF